MDTLASLNAEISDWRRAYNQVKEQYEGLLTVHRATKAKLRAEQTACAEAKNNDRIAMAWIADIKAAVGCEHMDMPQLVEYLKTMKLENTDEH
jgi:hypothetical protein